MKKDTHISSLVPSPPCRKQQRITCVLVCMCVCISACVHLVQNVYIIYLLILQYLHTTIKQIYVRVLRLTNRVVFLFLVVQRHSSCKESPYITEIAKHIQCIGTYNQELPIIRYTVIMLQCPHKLRKIQSKLRKTTTWTQYNSICAQLMVIRVSKEPVHRPQFYSYLATN